MNKNIIQFIVDENGQYISIPVGRVKAKSNLTTRIQLVTPITASTAVNYLIYDSKNINKKQYLIPTGDLGSAVVDPNNPNYQLVAGWNVYEADIYAPILSVISKYRTGKVGMSFEFVEQVPNALCVNFVGYFGFTKPLPQTSNNGNYFICEDYNFWLEDRLYNKGDILVWYNGQWNNGGILPKGLSETVDISVDPAISYPTEEVDETAFGNAIGEIGEDVAELDTRLNGVETDLNDKQDKVDLGLNTTVKTVVGAINEVKTQEEAHYNALNTNKLDKNFNLLVERTYAQLNDFVAIRSNDGTLKMTLETLRTYLTQGLVGLSFQIFETLPITGVGNIFYLTPMVDNIEHYATFNDLPTDGLEKILYVVDDEYTGGTTGWYVWNETLQDYESYNLGFYEIIWIEELNKYELIGSTQVDLTGYATETWVTNNFITKTQLSGGTTGQILTKKSDSDLDVEWTDVEIPIVNLNGVDMLRDPAKTYLVIKTPADNDTFTLLTGNSGSPNYTIEWGDGTSENITGTANPTHVYATAGMYLITISGSFSNGINVGNDANANKSKIIEVYGGSNYPLSIGGEAFRNCTSLTTANFPKATSIGDYAFDYCTNLNTANFPKVKSISINAFYSCTSLTTANFPNATSVVRATFSSCSSLITANFPKATSVGQNAFSSCTSLTTANFPKVTSITDGAFRSCTSLKELTLGNVTSTFPATAFQNVKLINLKIAQEVTDTDIERITTFFKANGGTFIGNETKHGLQIEKEPTADNDVVRKIDLDALSGGGDAEDITYNNATSGLTAVNVQDALDELESTKQDELVSGVNIRTVNNISLLGSGDITVSGGGAVNGVDYLKDPAKTYLVIKTPADNYTFELLTGDSGSPDYTIDWGDGISENITTTDNIDHTYANAGMYLITISGAFENGILYGFDANANKSKIIEVYGGSNYPLSIGGEAFRNCISLTTANFPKATSITDGAFRSCISLTTANFPNATSIDTFAFRNCTSLTTANFPKATSINNYAFSNCTSLTIANFPNATSIGDYAFSSCTSLTIANFPNATSIGDYAFAYCTLTTASFPLVTSIGNEAFRDCISLTTANFSNVTSIGNFAFRNCTSLTTANFPMLTSIGASAFENCTSLKELTIGNVTTTNTGTRFTNVKLTNLTIAQDVDTTDIDRIKQFYSDNGGTFTGAVINSI